MREATYWYLVANLNAAALEGGLVLAHATLELLSWNYIVVQRHLFSPKAFDKCSAAARIETLLQDLRIPVTLPALVPALQQWAGAQASGPKAISDLRNALMHPTPQNRGALASMSTDAKREASSLAIRYIELIILALCRYDGKHVNRLHRGVSIGEATEFVPWAKQPKPN